jgi:hypothetical protein
VLVVDDAQRDPLPARYDWNVSLPEDVVEVQQKPTLAAAGDIILAGKASLGADGTLKTGEPALLVRVLACQGQRLPTQIGPREKWNVLSLRTVAVAPDFKILLHAFRAGDPLPKTAWDADQTAVSVEFPDQRDVIRFKPSASGKSHMMISRGTQTLVKLIKPVAPLADAESEAITERLRQIPVRLAALRKQGYDPIKQSGFIAGWSFDTVVDGAVPPLPGSASSAAPVILGESKLVPGMHGRQAVAVAPTPLQSTLEFAKDPKGGPFTVACWIRIKSDPFFGALVNVEGILGSEFIQGSLRFNVVRTLNDNWPSSMLSSWTHLVFTCDGKQLCAYRNGLLISSVPFPEKGRFGWGKQFSLGGKSPYGDAEVTAQSIYFFNTALAPDAVENLYLWGKYGPSGANGPGAKNGE